MRYTLGIATLAALAAATLVSLLAAQEGEKSVAPLPPVRILPPDASLIWNFHFAGKKRKGEVIELVQLDAAEHGGKALVITHLDLRLPQSTRLELVEYRRDEEKKDREGKPAWTKTVRRGEALTSAGFSDSTTQWLLAGYNSLVGIVFDPGTRPSLEVTLGGGDMEVWAEGYWATRRPAGK